MMPCFSKKTRTLGQEIIQPPAARFQRLPAENKAYHAIGSISGVVEGNGSTKAGRCKASGREVLSTGETNTRKNGFH
jgi:hypothetical protein